MSFERLRILTATCQLNVDGQAAHFTVVSCQQSQQYGVAATGQTGLVNSDGESGACSVNICS